MLTYVHSNPPMSAKCFLVIEYGGENYVDTLIFENHAFCKQLTAILRQTHNLTSDLNDHATTSLIENWIDETERRTWFLFETTRRSR